MITYCVLCLEVVGCCDLVACGAAWLLIQNLPVVCLPWHVMQDHGAFRNLNTPRLCLSTQSDVLTALW